MATIKEIAAAAGVSATTVSNVIHGNASHTSPETLEKVQKIIKEQNYVPNMGAMILAHSFSKIIGVILQYTTRNKEKTFSDPFEGELLSALEEEIHKNGYYTMLSVVSETAEVIDLAATWKIDGLVIIGLSPTECGLLRSCTNTPIVFIDCYFKNDGNKYYNIGLNDSQGSYDMTKYLISMGHRRIAFLADRSVPRGVDHARLEGFKSALNDSGIPFGDSNYISLTRDKEVRHEILQGLVTERGNYTALFFASDYYAFDALNYFAENGVFVPEDYSVTGFDDNIFSRNARPKLTTVHQDVSEKGTQAVRMLLKIIRHQEVEETNMVLHTTLVIRDSVKKIEVK